MKIKYFYLAFVLFFIKINAQDAPPCWMDCPESEWELASTSIKLSDLGCPLSLGCAAVNIDISYWHRHAFCPSTMPPGSQIDEYDCQIKSIDIPAECINSCISNLSIFDIYKKALKQVFKEMKLRYQTDIDSVVWRAVNVSCWGSWTINGKVNFGHCLNTNQICCWKKYKVFESVSGVITYEVIAAYIPEGPPPSCYAWTHPCDYICNKSIDDPPPHLQKKGEFNNSNDSYTEISVFIDNIFNRYKGHQINFYDSNGKLFLNSIINEDFNLNILYEKNDGLFFYFVNDENGLNIENGKILYLK